MVRIGTGPMTAIKAGCGARLEMSFCPLPPGSHPKPSHKSDIQIKFRKKIQFLVLKNIKKYW
jgi:hypothetical protein